MSYQIITDSCCDLTEAMLQKLQVLTVPLRVVYGGESHRNFSEETAVKAFYDELRSGVTATTAAANPEDWMAVMRPVLECGRDILVLAFSSALSATYQSAVIAAQELGEAFPERSIRVVDTLCASLGQGLLVWYACRKRDAGVGLDELVQWVEENKLHLCHWVTVDDLNHLKRGGRINAATALVGSMMNIKPIIHMDDAGALVNVAKARGRKAAMQFIADKFVQLGEGYDNATVFIAHGDCPEEAAALEAQVRQQPGVETVYTGYVGPVIGAHTGPGVLVVFFMGEKR